MIADTASSILLRVVAPEDLMGVNEARMVLQWTFSSADMAAMNSLAERARQGVLSADEQALLDEYIQTGDWLNALHARARRALKSLASGDTRSA